MPEEERTSLGPYRLLRRLDRGGMSTVYEAEDPRLSRRVALKTLPDLWAKDPEQLERFRREAKTLAALNHPGIVTIYSVEEADGLPFLTMEWVEGRTLSEVMPEGGFRLEDFFDYALQIADALDAAHQRDVIHRDVKPGNIMVTPTGRLKVLDFGLAKRRQPRQEELVDSKTLTREGQMVGTLPYMSPEQLQGGLVDHRTDIFSFGIVLYQMITGRRPFEGESWGDLASAILRDDPPSVTVIHAHLPRHLGRILRHCLEKDVKRRFQTVLDLRNELAELHRELTTGELPSGTGRSVSLQRRRSRRPWLPLAILALVLVAGAVLWFAARRADSPAGGGAARAEVRRVVVMPFENLGPEDQAYFAAGVTEEITSRLARVGSLQVVSRRLRAGDEPRGTDFLLEGSVRWNDADSRDRPLVRVTARLVRTADGTQLFSQSYERVIDDLFAVQSEIAAEVIRQMDIVLLEDERLALSERPTSNVAAYQAFNHGMELAGRRNPSVHHWQEAVERFERAVELDPDFALAWAELSEVHSLAVQLELDGDPEARLRRVREARDAADRALAIDPDLPEGHRALGYLYYWGHRDFERALESFRRAAEGLPSDSQVLGGMAFVWRRMGRFEDAASALRRALDYDPDSAWLASELGDTLRRLRRYPEADQRYARAVALEPSEPAAFQLRCQNLLLWRGDLEGCRRLLRSMPRQTDTSSRLAWFELEMLSGDAEAAVHAVEGLTASFLASDTSRFPVELLHARAYAALGQPSRALPLFAAARRAVERQLEKNDDGDDPRLLSALARALTGRGDTDAAVAAAKHATELLPVGADAVTGAALLLDLAAVEAAAGLSESAIGHLESLLTVPADISPALLRLDRRWDPLRGHADFDALLETPARERPDAGEAR